MRAPISRQPDGSFHDRTTNCDYRLRQGGDHFEVVRTNDGASVGGFSMVGDTTVLDAELAAPDVVRAIAELVVTPRGLVPLQ